MAQMLCSSLDWDSLRAGDVICDEADLEWATFYLVLGRCGFDDGDVELARSTTTSIS